MSLLLSSLGDPRLSQGLRPARALLILLQTSGSHEVCHQLLARPTVIRWLESTTLQVAPPSGWQDGAGCWPGGLSSSPRAPLCSTALTTPGDPFPPELAGQESRSMALNWGPFCPLTPGTFSNVWRHFWFLQPSRRCYWNLMGRG